MAKNNKKQLAQSQHNPWILLAMGVISAALFYFVGSWAIYSGSLWVYALTFAVTYFTARFIYMSLNRDKPNKSKTSKR